MDIRVDLVCGHTGYDVAANSDQHLPKFEKRPKMLHPTVFGRILLAWRFACPTNWWASCSWLLNDTIELNFEYNHSLEVHFAYLSVQIMAKPEYDETLDPSLNHPLSVDDKVCYILSRKCICSFKAFCPIVIRSDGRRRCRRRS